MTPSSGDPASTGVAVSTDAATGAAAGPDGGAKTSTDRFRPDFLVLGAQKSGTSSLAKALRGHPDVFLPGAKEAHHYGMVPDDEVGGEAYRRFFAGHRGQAVVGEATPEYLYLPEACRQIVTFAPDVRAVVVLRNPVDRAYSAYWHGVRVGRIRGSFEGALLDEARALADSKWGFRSLFDRGRYVVQLERYVRAGLDRSQLLVVVHEDLVADPAAGLAAVQEHLGVEPRVTELSRANGAQRSVLPPRLRLALAQNKRRSEAARRLQRASLRRFTPPPMHPLTRRALAERYLPYDRALEEWLGRDLSVWRR